MSGDTFETRWADWKRRAECLDRRLRPIVRKEIDTSVPGWHLKLNGRPHPVDDAGVRQEVASFFDEIVAELEAFDAVQRQQVIDMMAQNDSLMCSAVLSSDSNTQSGFRKSMILVVLEDQGKDTRDAMLALDKYREHAEKDGIDVDAVFKEMAAMASTRNKYGWGSTRDLFLRH